MGGGRKAGAASDGDSQDEAGADHPSTLTSMNNPAFTLKAQVRNAEAMQLMDDCVQRRICILGARHPHFLSFYEALTEWQAEHQRPR